MIGTMTLHERIVKDFRGKVITPKDIIKRYGRYYSKETLRRYLYHSSDRDIFSSQPTIARYQGNGMYHIIGY